MSREDLLAVADAIRGIALQLASKPYQASAATKPPAAHGEIEVSSLQDNSFPDEGRHPPSISSVDASRGALVASARVLAAYGLVEQAVEADLEADDSSEVCAFQRKQRIEY